MAVCPPCLLSIWVQTLSGPFSSLNLAPVAGYLVKVDTSQNVETSTLAPLRCPLAHHAFYREPLPPRPVPLLYKIIEGSHIRVTSSPKIRTGSSLNVSWARLCRQESCYFAVEVAPQCVCCMQPLFTLKTQIQVLIGCCRMDPLTLSILSCCLIKKEYKTLQFKKSFAIPHMVKFTVSYFLTFYVYSCKRSNLHCLHLIIEGRQKQMKL